MEKFDIILADLNPVKGSEQAGIRPCLIIQNDFANTVSRTFVVAIISSVIKEYPHTLIVEPSLLNNLKELSRIDFLQVRTIDKTRIIKNIGKLDPYYRKLCNKKMETAFDL